MHLQVHVFQQRYKMVSQTDYPQPTKHTPLPMYRPPLPLPALLNLLCQIKRPFPVTFWTERLLPANTSPHNCHNSLWLPRTPTTARWRHIYDYTIEELAIYTSATAATSLSTQPDALLTLWPLRCSRMRENLSLNSKRSASALKVSTHIMSNLCVVLIHTKSFFPKSKST